MIGKLLRTALFAFALGGSACATAGAQTLALVGGRVYASPDAAPLSDAVVMTSNGVITAIGSRSEVSVPQDARVIDCTDKTIVAGFWNSHVHFTQSVWKNAGSAPVAALQEHMQEMLTKWGFTTVWDLGSDARDSLPLRRRDLRVSRHQCDHLPWCPVPGHHGTPLPGGHPPDVQCPGRRG